MESAKRKISGAVTGDGDLELEHIRGNGLNLWFVSWQGKRQQVQLDRATWESLLAWWGQEKANETGSGEQVDSTIGSPIPSIHDVYKLMIGPGPDFQLTPVPKNVQPGSEGDPFADGPSGYKGWKKDDPTKTTNITVTRRQARRSKKIAEDRFQKRTIYTYEDPVTGVQFLKSVPR